MAKRGGMLKTDAKYRFSIDMKTLEFAVASPLERSEALPQRERWGSRRGDGKARRFVGGAFEFP